MSEIVREPQQQRSIDKKNRIIEAGYSLFAEKGYFSTNTAEIAKEADVSTGIVYGYFHDKRDILLEVLDMYIDNVFYPVKEMLKKISQPLDFEKIITHAINCVVETHKKNAKIHESLHSLTSTDKEVEQKFLLLETEITKQIVDILHSTGYDREDIVERVHLTIETIQSYAHECVYDKHNFIDYKKMKLIVTKMLTSIFE